MMNEAEFWPENSYNVYLVIVKDRRFEAFSIRLLWPERKKTRQNFRFLKGPKCHGNRGLSEWNLMNTAEFLPVSRFDTYLIILKDPMCNAWSMFIFWPEQIYPIFSIFRGKITKKLSKMSHMNIPTMPWAEFLPNSRFDIYLIIAKDPKLKAHSMLIFWPEQFESCW